MQPPPRRCSLVCVGRQACRRDLVLLFMQPPLWRPARHSSPARPSAQPGRGFTTTLGEDIPSRGSDGRYLTLHLRAQRGQSRTHSFVDPPPNKLLRSLSNQLHWLRVTMKLGLGLYRYMLKRGSGKIDQHRRRVAAPPPRRDRKICRRGGVRRLQRQRYCSQPHPHSERRLAQPLMPFITAFRLFPVSWSIRPFGFWRFF